MIHTSSSSPTTRCIRHHTPTFLPLYTPTKSHSYPPSIFPFTSESTMIRIKQSFHTNHTSTPRNQRSSITFLQHSSFIDWYSKGSTPSSQNITILELKQITICTCCCKTQHIRMVFCEFRLWRSKDLRIGDVDELRHYRLRSSCESGLVDLCCVP